MRQNINLRLSISISSVTKKPVMLFRLRTVNLNINHSSAAIDFISDFLLALCNQQFNDKSDVIFVSAYIRAAATLCVITLLTDLTSTVLTGLGLITKDHHTKYKYYRFAVIVMGLACK